MALAVSITCANPASPPYTTQANGEVDGVERSTNDSSGLPTAADVASAISIQIETPYIDVGGRTRARATLQDPRLRIWLRRGHPLVWTSSDRTVATVATLDRLTSVIRGLGPGSADITATIGGVSGSARLTVGEVHAPVASVAVTLGAARIDAGASTTATAVLRDAAGNTLTDRAITWTSSDPTIALVDATTGNVMGMATGSADIIATSEGVSGRASISVNSAVVAVTVALGAPTLVVGGTTQATATARDINGQPLSGRAVCWSSSNPAVATVDESTGLVTAVAEGTAAIRATSEGVTGEAAVAVTRLPVASVTVTLNAATIPVGSTTTAAAVTRDANNAVLTGRAITWTSSDPTVASVDAATGVVTGVAEGSASIRATSEGVTGQADVTVAAAPPAPVASVVVTLASSALQIGQTTTASAVTRDAANNELTGRAVVWSSNNPGVAAVDAATGLVTALTAGTANIIATSEGITGQATVTVSLVPVASVTVTLNSSTITTGSSTNAVAVTRDANGAELTGRAVTWSSSNPAVATVNATTGLVRGIAEGSANIRATSEGVMGQAQVTVIRVAVASVMVSLGSATITVGQTTSASAATRDASNNVLTGRAIAWSSSNALVATVTASGTVTGVAQGTADITATSEGVAGSATVTVNPSPPPPPPPPPGANVFASDWSGAVGNFASGAPFDGGKWDRSVDGGGPADRLQVVPAAGLGFPSAMPNVLKVLQRNSDSDYWNVNAVGQWTLPPVGGSIYFRLYFRYDVGGSGGGSLHTVQTGPPGGCPYTAELEFAKVSATEIEFIIANFGGSSSSSNGHTWTTRLSKQQTYRVEEQYTRTGTNSWKVHARIYDSSDRLIRQDADFIDTFGGGTMATFTGNITSSTDCFRNKMIGNPGDGGRGSTDAAHQHIYYGGFAVSHAGWIGPYVAGEGRQAP